MYAVGRSSIDRPMIRHRHGRRAEHSDMICTQSFSRFECAKTKPRLPCNPCKSCSLSFTFLWKQSRAREQALGPQGNIKPAREPAMPLVKAPSATAQTNPTLISERNWLEFIKRNQTKNHQTSHDTTGKSHWQKYEQIREKYVFLYAFLRPFTGKIRPFYRSGLVSVPGTYFIRKKCIFVVFRQD